MGSNSSALHKQRSSSLRDSPKPHINSVSEAETIENKPFSPTTTKHIHKKISELSASVVESNSLGNSHNGSSAARELDYDSNSSSKNLPEKALKKLKPTKVSNTKHTQKSNYPSYTMERPRLTPNRSFDHLFEKDYFGVSALSSEDRQLEEKAELNNKVSDVLNGTNEFDDDACGIDDDLISAVRLNESKKNVLVKFKSSRNDLRQDDTVFVIGSWNNWKRKVKLSPIIDKENDTIFFQTLMPLSHGVHRLNFIVNNEIKNSSSIPMATDKRGNVVNWFEVNDDPDEVYEAGFHENHKIITHKLKSSLSLNQSDHQNQKSNEQRLGMFTPVRAPSPVTLVDAPPKEKMEYSQQIPLIYQTALNPNQDDQLIDEEFLHKHAIPELPVYLNNTYLNKHFNTHHNNNNNEIQAAKLTKKAQQRGLNSHIMPHVNLNHLLTSNIKNNTLSVACTTRYFGKFVTNIMYSPSDYDLS